MSLQIVFTSILRCCLDVAVAGQVFAQEFSVKGVKTSDFAGEVNLGGGAPNVRKPQQGSEFLWVLLAVGTEAKLPITVNLFEVKVVSGKGSYSLVGLDTLIKETCCNMSATLGEMYKHAGGGANDSDELSINNMGQKKTSALTLRKLGGVFSLAFEVPTNAAAFEIQGVGQRAISVKKPDSKGDGKK